MGIKPTPELLAKSPSLKRMAQNPTLAASTGNIVVREGDEMMKHVSFEHKNKEYNFGAAGVDWPIVLRIPLKNKEEQKLAAGGPIKLYHGSTTGVDDATLKNFKEKGALADIAQGWGQGAGFYVWSGKNKAKAQAIDRTKNGLGSFTVFKGDTKGRPMVLTFEEILDPKTWDLDYELNKTEIIKWLHDNYDTVKKDLMPDTNAAGIQRVFTPSSEPDPTTGEYITGKGILGQNSKGQSKRMFAGVRGDIDEGAILGEIMSRLQSANPDFVAKFENGFFKSPSLASGDWDDLALKYVGSTPLIPTNIETFASGGSVSAMVSSGEAYVSPKLARKIGYAKLDKMNQADRNGMKNFASGGGIGVFNGPGSGTSDSIGPVSLPVGSYIIRQKATKALGLHKNGGQIGIRRFADGGPAGEKLQSQRFLVTAKRAERDKLESQRSIATDPAEKKKISEKMKAVQEEINNLEDSIRQTEDEFKNLSGDIEEFEIGRAHV